MAESEEDMTEYARNNIVGIVKAMTSEEKQLVSDTLESMKWRERKMFKLRVQYLDGQVNDIVADNNTLVLLETMMRYGIIARLTCKLR